MKTSVHLVLLTALLAMFVATGRAGAEHATEVFLLAGQSNMDGRGDGSRLTAEDLARLDAVRDRVSLSYNGGTPEPLDLTMPKPYTAEKFGLELTFGPELFFGIRMAEAWPDRNILLIKRSLGGMSLYGAWNPHWNADHAAAMGEIDKPKLFQELLNDISTTLAGRASESYRYAGMLWVQGEADSSVKKFGTAAAEAYVDNLQLLIREIRGEIDQPELPFYMLQVGGGDVVAGMQRAAAEMKNVFFIPQSRDPKSPDYLPKYGPPVGHYNYEGMKRIGLAFAYSVLQSEGET